MPETKPLTVLIATWLEPEQVRRIETAVPGMRVLYEPALLPSPRYVADHHGEPPALSAAEQRRWRAMLAEADVAFDFDWADPANLPANAPRLRWVQGTSAGIGEFLESTGLIRSSIAFTTAAGVHATPLAEFVLLGLLYFYRDVPKLLRMQAASHWERLTNRELSGSRMLLVGLGGVGREVARRCAESGIEVWAMRRTSGGDAPAGVTRLVAPHELCVVLSDVDALVLACPLTPQTRGLIGAAEIAALRPSAVLVNVARGQVVDEPAMIAALQERRLAGAALDVTEIEPLPPDSPLWSLPNVLISPHSASTVHAENERIVDIFIDNLNRFREGRPLRNVFGRERGY